jgi:hypothetical protein
MIEIYNTGREKGLSLKEVLKFQKDLAVALQHVK